MRLARFALLVALAVAVSACRGDSGISVETLPRIVLQPTDVPTLSQFDEGRIGRSDQPIGKRADPRRFDRKDGWVTRYRALDQSGRGPLVVESRADVFGSADGARQDLAAFRDQSAEVAKLLDAPDLGDDALAAVQTQPGFPTAVRTYTIAWREANVLASVLVQGFEGELSFDEVLALARKQQRRIEAAAG
jgi:hypothetical protein